MNCKWILVVECNVSRVDFPLWDSATGWTDKQEAAGVWCLTREASSPPLGDVWGDPRGACSQERTLIPCASWCDRIKRSVSERNLSYSINCLFMWLDSCGSAAHCSGIMIFIPTITSSSSGEVQKRGNVSDILTSFVSVSTKLDE